MKAIILSLFFPANLENVCAYNDMQYDIQRKEKWIAKFLCYHISGLQQWEFIYSVSRLKPIFFLFVTMFLDENERKYFYLMQLLQR